MNYAIEKRWEIDIDPLSDSLTYLNNTFFPRKVKTVLPPMGALFNRVDESYLNCWLHRKIGEKVPIGFWFTDAILQLIFMILMACNISRRILILWTLHKNATQWILLCGFRLDFINNPTKFQLFAQQKTFLIKDIFHEINCCLDIFLLIFQSKGKR